MIFSLTITSLRLCGLARDIKKDLAKTLRKKGSRKIMDFVSMKQYLENPIILSEIFFKIIIQQGPGLV